MKIHRKRNAAAASSITAPRQFEGIMDEDIVSSTF